MTLPLIESEERQALRDVVSALARAHGWSYFARCIAQQRFPDELWAELSSSGFAGPNVSESDGGPGGTLTDLAVVAEEVAAAGCPLMTLVVSPAVCGPLISEFGSQAQRATWLKGIGDGSVRMAFALTEPEAGSNTHRIRTRLRQVAPGRWHLRGEKHFISGVDEAAGVLVVTRVGANDETPARFGLAIVDPHAPGVQFTPVPMQVRAAERQFVVRFDDVELTDRDLIGESGLPLAALFRGLNPERLVSAATCIGLGRYFVERAAGYARSRTVWAHPIGAHQGIAHPLVRAHAAVESARVLLSHTLELTELGRETEAAANLTKLLATEAVAQALEVAIQVHGGNGLSDEYGIAHLWGLVRMYGIAPVSREMMLNHIATHDLGLPKSY
ncbi:MAG: acyl-CoA/acyl-ACP dehydrogenase [Nocardioidaceae bacterium]|nr:MAG: acyl-CoA/acyl-ACP dehydrogenase [Nocardioidaceae bacterium]